MTVTNFNNLVCPVCDSDRTECKLSYDQAIRVLSIPFITILKQVQKEISKHGIKSSLRLAVSGRKKEADPYISPSLLTSPLPFVPPTPFIPIPKANPYSQTPVSTKYIFGLPGIFGTCLFFNANGTKTRLWYEASNSNFVGECYDLRNPTEELLTGEFKRIVLSVPYDLLSKKWKHYIITEFKDFADANQYDPDNIAKIAVNLIIKLCETNDMLQKECQYIIYEKRMPNKCSTSDFLVLVRKP